jgi:hypothetical protein
VSTPSSKKQTDIDMTTQTPQGSVPLSIFKKYDMIKKKNQMLINNTYAQFFDAGASLQASYTPSSQHIKAHVQWRGEVQVSHFQISNFEIVLNVVRPKSQNPCMCAGFR